MLKQKYLLYFLILTTLVILMFTTYYYFIQALIYKYTHKLVVSDFWNYVYIFNEIFVKGDYNEIVPKNGSIIFDVGANQGLYSLYLNDRLKGIEIHVFEPINQIFQELKANIQTNKKEHNKIIMNNFGLSDQIMTTEINHFPQGSGLSTMEDDLDSKMNAIMQSKCEHSILPFVCKNYMNFLLQRIIKGRIKQHVYVVPMSDYIDNNNIQNIDMVKIDVEGHELEVVKGIRSNHFDIIKAFIIEVENYRPGYLQQIITILENHSFDIRVSNRNANWCMVYAVHK